jgi:hypothetical protein
VVLDRVPIAAAAVIPPPLVGLIAVVATARTRVRASGPTGVAIGGGRDSISAVVRKKARQCIENGPLHVGGRNAGFGPSFALSPSVTGLET